MKPEQYPKQRITRNMAKNHKKTEIFRKIGDEKE